MNHNESGVSEIVSAILAIILVIALAAIIGAIFFGWAVPLQKTAYLATQATPVNITNASAVQLFMSQGEAVSLAPAMTSGLPVKFSLTNGSATYNFVPLPGAASAGWKPGTSLILFRNASGSWIAGSTASVQNNIGFSNGTWTVNIIDATSNVLIAQHTVTLTGGGAPAPYPVYPGFTVEAWVKWLNKPSIPVPSVQTYAVIVVDGSSDANRRYALQHNISDTCFEFDLATINRSSGRSVQSNTNPANGMWYLVTGVYNQTPGTSSFGNMSIFVNGFPEKWLIADSTGSGLKGSPGIPQIGGKDGVNYGTGPPIPSQQRRLNGSVPIAGVQHYEYAMSQAEIRAHYIAGPPPA